MAAIGFWNDGLVARVTRLYADGYSCRAIGAEIGASRNAVIGKVYRLGLVSPPGKRCDASRSELKPKKTPAKRITTTHSHTMEKVFRSIGKHFNSPRVLESIQGKPYQLRCVDIEPLDKTLLELEKGECRQPYGDGPGYLFCGHPAKEGSSYCVPHHAINWEPPRILTDRAPVREVA